MVFKEVYDCEIIFISEIQEVLLVYDYSVKDYSDKVLKDRLGRSVLGTRYWVEPTGRPRETWKR